MKVTLQIVGDTGEDEARSLHEWLLMDRKVRGGAQMGLTSSSPPVPGQQGSVFDIVSLALGSGFNAAALGVSIASWRATRPQQPTVTVEREGGTKVTITGTSPQEAQRLVEQLLGDR
ncbi:effector-associated constant component EACC1 [Streptomyces sp. SYP-A7185]|uniref:effector-associated constant component EACC1 n=1 Tax=Streptomyces sp. SYP-A7185 TaxID=3040076 RepID=UPI0038F81E0A